MRAVIMDAPGQIRVAEWQTQRPGAGEVMVQVNATGICAGDMYIYQGKNPYVIFPAIGESVSEIGRGSLTASWRSFFCVVGAKVGGWKQKMGLKASQRRKK